MPSRDDKRRQQIFKLRKSKLTCAEIGALLDPPMSKQRVHFVLKSMPQIDVDLRCREGVKRTRTRA